MLLFMVALVLSNHHLCESLEDLPSGLVFSLSKLVLSALTWVLAQIQENRDDRHSDSFLDPMFDKSFKITFAARTFLIF